MADNIYPDSGTPFRSSDEMVNVMGERDPRGVRRYDSDAAFRRAVEQKIALGYTDGVAPSTYEGTGALSSTGKDLSYGQVVLRDGELERVQEKVAVDREINELQVSINQLRIQEVIEAAEAGGVIGSQVPAPAPFASRAEMRQWMGHAAYRNGQGTVVSYVEARMARTDLDRLPES